MNTHHRHVHPLVPLVKASKQHESKIKILQMLRRGEQGGDITDNLAIPKGSTAPAVYSQPSQIVTTPSRPRSRALYYA